MNTSQTLPVPAVPPRPAPSMRLVGVTLIVAVLALVPLAAALAAQAFYLTIVTRIMVFALAALGLNLVLGFGAMVSFGHAMYIGIGAYAVGILSSHGITSGWAHVGAALGVGLVCALPIGAVCLRATGVAFIMITLAFAQMFYFLAVGLKQYGGDDGLPISVQSDFTLFSLGNATVLYYTVFAVLMVTLYVFHRRCGCSPESHGCYPAGIQSQRFRLRLVNLATAADPPVFSPLSRVLKSLPRVCSGLILACRSRPAAGSSFPKPTCSG